MWVHCAVQMEPVRAYWQRCRLVPARTKGGRSAFLLEIDSSADLKWLACISHLQR